MGAPRRFDHDEARRMHAAGTPVKTIAGQLGVTVNAIYRLTSPGWLERENAYHRDYQSQGVCVDCGERCSRGHARCHGCASKAQVTSVRDDSLKCQTCHTWKPDDAFPRNVTEGHRRGRHSSCTACHARIKRAWRARPENRERERDLDRARRRRKTRLQPAGDPS